MMTPATIEPRQIRAGDTARWVKPLPAYPASAGWVLSYILLNTTDRIVISSTPAGSDHSVTVPAATTANWPPGDYAWGAQVSRAGEVYTVLEGRVTIRPSLAALTLETRSRARMALDAVEGYLADPNNLTSAKYAIAGRTLDKIPFAELWKHRDRLRVEVSREEQAERLAAGLPDTRRMYVRFGP